MSVIIIGCGIAGPVLAMLLKHKGFQPTIYDGAPGLVPAGIGMTISSQTFKVLDIIGLADTVIKRGVVMDKARYLSSIQERELVHTDGPTNIRTETGWPLVVISRSTYANTLYQAAVDRGISVHFGKRFVDVQQADDSVTAIFEDETKVEGEVLFGDGLHSALQWDPFYMANTFC